MQYHCLVELNLHVYVKVTRKLPTEGVISGARGKIRYVEEGVLFS